MKVNKGNLKKSGSGGSKATQKPTGKPARQEKRNLSDYYYYLGSSAQASDYESTTSFVINYIKKTFKKGNDIATALKKLEHPDTDEWRVKLRKSEAEDEETREAENEQFRMEFKSDYEKYQARVDTYNENLVKAYALLWERCNKGMKDKIEDRKNFSSEIENDPVELLKAIKEHAQNYQENRYPMAIIYDSLRALMHCKQRDGEGVQDWTKRFKLAREVFESHVGGHFVISKLVQANPKYEEAHANKQKEIEKQTWKAFMAYM